MNRICFLGAAALALAAGAAPALAQTGPQTEIVARPNPDADRLASDIRVLAADPRDLSALLDAGVTSVRLGDTAAALAFFQRAEAVDPANPRIAAGRGMALVRLERPGEALRLFQAAEARGLPPGEYAADRGFAYDLLGQPALAQRDYRLALAGGGGDDETVRRYALSLGISGDTAEAMRQLDPLLRRSDRAAWRARAFILAMNGDVAGAERIASSMMPGNMGSALSPFFRRLGGLSPADRAFAVHFGELSPTQARLADARLAPELPRGAPPPAPVQLAAAPAVAAPAPRGRERAHAGRREAVAAPPAQPTPAPAPAPDPLPPPPQFVQRQEPIVQPLPAPAPTPVQLASRLAPAPEALRGRGGSFSPAAANPVPPRPEPVPPGPARVGQEDSVLAAIVRGISIPAEELEAVNAPPADPPAAAPVRAAEARPPAVARPKPEPAKPEARTKKPEPRKPDPARAEPKRIWVQVAGGANEAMLGREWQRVAAKAPAAMKGRSAWWTPLRATNRVLAGPFKTAGEAQAFVNALGKAGLSAFVFTSEAGQKINPLAVK